MTDTVLVRPEPGSVAVTWYVPATEPAVYNPALVIPPPVAVQCTDGVIALPSLIVPVTVNCIIPATCTEASVGETVIVVSVGGGGGAVTVTEALLASPEFGSVAVTW